MWDISNALAQFSVCKYGLSHSLFALIGEGGVELSKAIYFRSLRFTIEDFKLDLIERGGEPACYIVYLILCARK